MAVITTILGVFTSIAEWFADAIPTVISLFYAENVLTFLGGLAVTGLGISVVFLLMGVISNFLHFRG